jgi:L-ascorbate metabolism protein UlaG (beta-lactamase superfamily)
MSEASPGATLEFVGTATTLLRLGEFTVLTDPNFLHRGQRAYLGRGLWSKRRTEPALQPNGLPPLDGVVLSHLHGDHFDRIARHELDHELPLVTTEHAAGKLERWGFAGTVALESWQTHELAKAGQRLRITAMPGQHAPGPAKHLLPSVMGSVLELSRGTGGRPFRLYISGDTLYRPWLSEVVARMGPLDAALLHLGGTRILGMLVTMDDEQGADLVELLSPLITVPVHHDDYGVFRSSLSDFLVTCKARGLSEGIRPVRRGETISLT